MWGRAWSICYCLFWTVHCLSFAFPAAPTIWLRNTAAATASLSFAEEAWQRAAGVRPLKITVNTRCWNVVDASHDTATKRCMKIVFVNNSITVSWFRHMGHRLTPVSALNDISENVWKGYVCLFSQWVCFISYVEGPIGRSSDWQNEAMEAI